MSSRLARWRTLPSNFAMAVRMVRTGARREFAIVVAAAVISGLALIVVLFCGRQLIVQLSPDAAPDSVWSPLLLVVILGIGAATIGITSAIDTEVRWILAHLVERQAAAGIVTTATVVPLAEFESPEFQDHLQRSLRQSVHQPWEITQAVSQLMVALCGCLAISIVLATVQPLLIPAVVLVGAPLAFATTRNSEALYEAVRAVTSLTRERQYLQDILTGRDQAKEIRAFEAADQLRGRYADRYDQELAALRRVSRLRARRSLLAGIAAMLLTVGVLAALIVLSIRGRVSVADAAVGAVAVQQLAMRLRGVNLAVSSIQEASLFLDDYADFLARGDQGATGPVGRPPAVTEPSAAVQMHDVWFSYPGADGPALRGVDLTIDRGRLVALVGANGSGKTTIAKLVCGLYQPERGQVCWDTGARPRAGVIFQDFVRYEFTARDNVALGDLARADDDPLVVGHAKAARVHEFLAALPFGYDTWLSPSFEGGTDLSVGQWQRVAMARALFREAPLLVLDEPTAALDPAAERDLITATKRMFADKAVLVISHRLATVAHADVIHVLDGGRIVESGSHGDLMAQRGRYAEMYRLQTSSFEGATDG